PRDKGTVQPLPRLAFLLVGGWFAWEFLTPWLERALTPQLAAWLSDAAPWALPTLAVVLGAAAGWVLSRPLNHLLGWLFRRLNRGFDKSTGLYTKTVSGLLRVSLLVLLVYGGLLALTYGSFTIAPKGFIPTQDKGYLLVNLQLPDSASVLRTQRIMQRLEK